MQEPRTKTLVDLPPGKSRRLRWARGYGSRPGALLRQQSAAGGGKVLCLGGVEMNGLRVQLRGRGSALGDVNTDTQRAHNIHPNQHRGRFEADEDDEASSPSSFAPL